MNVEKFNTQYGSSLSKFFNKKEEKLNKIKEHQVQNEWNNFAPKINPNS